LWWRINCAQLHHRSVGHFSEGRVFLAGESAHIHSLAGGQGMNTGLQDAYNLCWKLAFVLKRQANASLLDTYKPEFDSYFQLKQMRSFDSGVASCAVCYQPTAFSLFERNKKAKSK
jgi:2-polyprenyl-6-methoxyphenol hydroxylase-like FAD-dependent oxidoreductase